MSVCTATSRGARRKRVEGEIIETERSVAAGLFCSGILVPRVFRIMVPSQVKGHDSEHHPDGQEEILWLELEVPKAFETRRGVLRVFVGYCRNKKCPQPIQLI